MAFGWDDILGGVVGLFGADKSAKAAENAANTQAQIAREIADKQLQLQREQFQQAMNMYGQQQGKIADYYRPYQQAGEAALGKLQADALGGERSELYKLQQEDLTRQMNAQAAARGQYGSGRTMQMLGDQQRRLGASEAQRQQGLLSSLYRGGMQSAQGLGNAAMNYGSQAGNLTADLGGALSNIYGGMGNQLINSANQIGQAQSGYYGDVYGGLASLLTGNRSSQPNSPTPTLTNNSTMNTFNNMDNLFKLPSSGLGGLY